jgi:transposase
VRKWRSRWSPWRGLSSLDDAYRSGRPARVPPGDRAALIKLACDVPEEMSFRDVWTYPALQEALLNDVGRTLSVSEIGRILRAEEIRPHRMKVWLHSPDPDFAPKVDRVTQLYLNPPAGSVVLCVDEKPGIQALERIHPTKLAKRGIGGRFEFEYVRHGTKTLIAALDVANGTVFGQVRNTRKAKDLMAFMEALAKRYPTGDVYIVWDNLNIHYDGPTERWIKFNRRHGGRFHFVYTPLHASWVNQIEIWFSILQRRVIRRGSFRSGEELVWRILGFIGRYNRVDAKPCRWKFRGTTRSRSRRRAA